jgi:hypothetical protein
MNYEKVVQARQRAIQRKIKKMENQRMSREIMKSYLASIRYSNRCGSHEGCIRVNSGSTFAHELTKFLVCWELAKKGEPYITEAIFAEHKGRPDVVCIQSGVIYEVLKSETEEMLADKETRYPGQFEIRKIKAVSKLEDWDPKCME